MTSGAYNEHAENAKNAKTENAENAKNAENGEDEIGKNKKKFSYSNCVKWPCDQP